MGISPQYFAATDSLIQPRKTKFYPLDIPVPHHQLRHFISTVDQDWIYFVSRHDIYALHIPSQRKSLLVTLPFSARCLVAGLGWVCVGGDLNGDTAFIRLNKNEPEDRFRVVGRTAAKTLPDLGQSNQRLKTSPEVVLHELGGQIVNSITLHELSNAGRSDWNEPVALVSNNDQTVKIYSLLQQNLIADLRHLFAMNYALISPDSETLVAVGDSDQAYFYRRKLVTSKNLSQGRFPRYDWKVLAKPKLARGDRTENDHSFSITFSPSGHLCAISAQGGMISVFDMDIFKRLGEDDDAESCGPVMLCSFTSSRSGVHGYVRSMAFSPAPWDLLVWAEDHGRAGIADVRQAFCRRQIIKLETHAPDLEKIDCEDLTDPYVKGLDIRGRLIHQYQENFHSQGGSAGTESLLGAPEDWSDGAALQRQESRRAELPDLDAREQSVLDTLEITMQEVDDAMTNVLHPYSVNYRPSPHLRPNVDDDERSPSRAHLETLIDVFRARNLQRVHGSDRQYQPRRRNSVVLSQGIGLGANGASRLTPGTGPRSRITASPARMLEADVEPDGSRLSTIIPTNNPTPAAGATDSHPQPYNILPPDPWHVAQSSHDPSTRPNSLPVASWLTPPNSQHDENDMADSGPAGHLSPPDNLSTDRTSAQTSTLPTTLNNTQAQTLLRLQSNQSLLRRAVPLSELDTERQIRRLASITADPESREGRIRPRTHTGDERHSRNLETRVQARQRMNVRDLEQPSITSATVARPSATQRSELSGRVTHADIRLARQMMMQTTRYMVDRNGNWLAGPTLERTSGHANSEGANGLGGSFDASEKGVGTAGVGWSADGRQLYIGTEEGIFEYAVNLTDRKVFPALDLR